MSAAKKPSSKVALDVLLISDSGEVQGRPQAHILVGSRNAVPCIEHFSRLIASSDGFSQETIQFDADPPFEVVWISEGGCNGIVTFQFRTPDVSDAAMVLSRLDREDDAVTAEWFWKSMRDAHPDVDWIPAMAATQATTLPVMVIISSRRLSSRPPHIDFAEMCFAFGVFWLASRQKV